MVKRFAVVALALLVPDVAATAISCSDPDGGVCSLNGICTHGTCVCDDGWTGDDCGLLDLLPAPSDTSFHGINDNASSWGGSVLRLANDKYAMFAAEMTNGCTLRHWTTNSEVVLALADKPTGPYTEQFQVITPWSHNPEAIITDGNVVVYTLGNGIPLHGPEYPCDAPPGPPPPPSLWPKYPALKVWPMPTNVTLCGGEADGPSCVGPHSIASTVAIAYTGGCSPEVAPLAAEAVGLDSAVTAYKRSPDTYNAPPYADEEAYCTKHCSVDADCGGNGNACFIPSDKRWSPKNGCSPSSKYGVGCGCCTTTGSPALPAITTITVDCGDNTVTAPEGYTLSVTSTSITVAASTSNGAAYGLTTLAQVIRHDVTLGAGVIDFVPLKIADAPKYSWRGEMLDTSRHFVAVFDILRFIDGLYAAKMNVFHWHIVDAPSFPMDSVSFPELAQAGSWDGTNATIYSVADQEAVAARAKARFVELVIEIDTPAHTLAVSKAHPEMMSDCWEWMAVDRYKTDVDSDDCMAMNPINPAARDMVKTLLKEAAARQGADSKYVHIGGDEVKFDCWKSDPAIAAYVTKTYGDTSPGSFSRLQAEWTANVSAAAVVEAGKCPVLWQPTTQGPGDPAWDGKLPKDAIYMIWLNAASAKSYAQNGSAVVYTTPFYVAGQAGSSGWLSVYNAQIMPAGLSPAQQANVLGAEICIWGESNDAGNLGVRGFQIGAAAAENFWRDHMPGTGAGGAAGIGFADRYNRFLCHLRRFGIDAAPVTPSSCVVV